MRYQNSIVERLRQGLAAIDRDESDNFVKEFTRPRHTLKEFADEANAYFNKLLKDATQGNGQMPLIGTPENADAIPYWIEDLERAVYPDLRISRLVK
ncbi:hypothetical protein BIZ78_gp050 [Erwinia phage vB_EamM_Caitlin]|uniref:hypothetical protein n=1 Tax=Erwinia phage vB_EamM_Caitlin TaxID=1883379 RepID=UPI00081D014F|nr:hypothetical protein BIZ78_gp050 [Erwinia phage vB_EamM_Caitlin]ANZ48525.1 hypothetical protein CAITLIN_230 [Erwinia phage vB_EamM_Caitlin]